MESVLIVVTVVSMGLAVTMSFVAWTLLRGDRQRSAARVEALEALAFDPDSEVRQTAVPAASRTILPADPGEIAPAADVDRNAEGPRQRQWDLALRADRSRGLDLFDDALDVGVRPGVSTAMFAAGQATGAAGRRWLAIAAVGLLVLAGFAIASALRSPEIVAAMAASAGGANNGSAPLELLSLRHTAEADGAFTVSGFVQNPAAGQPLSNVEVVVYLFDRTDQYLATGRAALDIPMVRPGGESPFAVRIPNGLGVNRYRVGFRQEGETVVAHVDRRGRMPEGTTGGTLEAAEVAQPAGGMKPLDGALVR
jgi:hypothetical protein